jgi:hypothetical protein
MKLALILVVLIGLTAGSMVDSSSTNLAMLANARKAYRPAHKALSAKMKAQVNKFRKSKLFGRLFKGMKSLSKNKDLKREAKRIKKSANKQTNKLQRFLKTVGYNKKHPRRKLSAKNMAKIKLAISKMANGVRKTAGSTLMRNMFGGYMNKKARKSLMSKKITRSIKRAMRGVTKHMKKMMRKLKPADKKMAKVMKQLRKKIAQARRRHAKRYARRHSKRHARRHPRRQAKRHAKRYAKRQSKRHVK